MNIDDEWEKFMDKYDDGYEEEEEEPTLSADLSNELGTEPVFRESIQLPVPSELYISTKSKIAFLNQALNLKKIFWGLNVISYSTPQNGIIKKQMKFNSFTQEELDEIKEYLQKETHYEEHIITSINNPNGRIKFKDIRKVSVGISKKDLITYRTKKKSAFYNCFVMILRLKIDGMFREFHVKVFNTGKMEMPGVQNDAMFQDLLNTIVTTLQPFTDEPLSYLQKSDTVLVNSNFNCGFYIHREIFYELLKNKYNIQCIYDPCSYPGIQCKFYYHRGAKVQTGTQKNADIATNDVSKDTLNIDTTSVGKRDKNIVEVSFMIFRTGSILIVGMCDDTILYTIYHFLKELLIAEFPTIHQKIVSSETETVQKKKVRRKTVIMNDYAASVTTE
jgi:hypothetical protein